MPLTFLEAAIALDQGALKNANFRAEDGWLPCCYGGWDTMNYRDQKGFGKSARGVFDCSCYKPLLQA
jgi:hypothetical protein